MMDLKEGVSTWLSFVQRVSKRLSLERAVTIALVWIVLLGAFLRFYKLGAYGVGNAYYAATVKSMLTSWHNFFFVAFEPGGSVTVDKPPLGFWVQAISAYFLGVNGFSLALPQALAGTLSIPLIYSLVKRPFGRFAGLVSALALAITPVTIAAERNNTIDGLLLFVLLLAAWAFWHAVEEGKLRYLLLGALLVGLGFNIKMLQAFMPLPAFYALYFLVAPQPWGKRILHLLLATVVLVVVSISWAVVVDLTPAENRPYIGSSTNNTVMELIIGHNGLKRLGLDRLLASGNDAALRSRPQHSVARGDQGQRPLSPPPQTQDIPAGTLASSQVGPAGQLQAQILPVPQGTPPALTGNGGQPSGSGQDGGGSSNEVGKAGWSRLFTAPLYSEASWLLPFALSGLVLSTVVIRWQWPLNATGLGLVLWAGWLLPELAYFSFTTGLFHTYYLMMLGPPLAALVGITAWAFGQILQRQHWLGCSVLAFFIWITVIFQCWVLLNSSNALLWLIVPMCLLVMVGFGLLMAGSSLDWMRTGALSLILVGLMVAPLVWSGLTTFNTNPNTSLPHAGPDTSTGPGRKNSTADTLLTPVQETLVDFLMASTEPDSYLVATLNANEAAPYVLATSRPVLTFGGFIGSDDVISVSELERLVSDGELRFVLAQGLEQKKPEITDWLASHCDAASLPGIGPLMASTHDAQNIVADNLLYDCGGY